MGKSFLGACKGTLNILQKVSGVQFFSVLLQHKN